MDNDLILDLKHKNSVKRRSAAKKLRKVKNISAINILEEALKKEIKDKRTWETQYHMLMAIAENDFIFSLPFLYSLLDEKLEYMVNIALGHAITKLEFGSANQFPTLNKTIEIDRQDICEGGFRAIALLHLTPDLDLIEKIIAYVSTPTHNTLRFWVAAGSAGWNFPFIKDFLKEILRSNEAEETKKAAEAALKGKYLKWNIL